MRIIKMCCFFIPTAGAAILTLTSAALKNNRNPGVQLFRRHADGLSKLLAGGSLLLALEHIWHGEITFHFPFITAMETPEDTAVMLQELADVGVPMALLVTFAYITFSALRSFFAGHASAARDLSGSAK